MKCVSAKCPLMSWWKVHSLLWCFEILVTSHTCESLHLIHPSIYLSSVHMYLLHLSSLSIYLSSVHVSPDMASRILAPSVSPIHLPVFSPHILAPSVQLRVRSCCSTSPIYLSSVHISPDMASHFLASPVSPVHLPVLSPCLTCHCVTLSCSTHLTCLSTCLQSTCSCSTSLTCAFEVYSVQQRVHLWPLAISPQRAWPPSWWHVGVEFDVGHTLLLHAVIGDVQTEDVCFIVPQCPLPQHQVHAVLASCCGVQVQNQRLIVTVYCRPALTKTHRKHTWHRV